MFALIFFLLISAFAISTSLIESFYTPEELEGMGVFLENPSASEPNAQLEQITERNLPDHRLQPAR